MPAESHKCDIQLQISFLESPAYGKSTWKMLPWLSLKRQAVRGSLYKTVCLMQTMCLTCADRMRYRVRVKN